ETCTRTKMRSSATSWRRRSITRGRGASGTDPPRVATDGRKALRELHAHRSHEVVRRPEAVQVREPLRGGDHHATLQDAAAQEQREIPAHAPLAHADARHDLLYGQLAGRT